MTNENRCFFSISLENGIIITGNNPDEVKKFLWDLDICLTDVINSRLNNKYVNWIENFQKLKAQIDNAWTTIYNNQNKERK